MSAEQLASEISPLSCHPKINAQQTFCIQFPRMPFSVKNLQKTIEVTVIWKFKKCH